MTKCFYFIILIPFCLSKGPSSAISYLLVTRVGPCPERKITELVVVAEMSLHKEKFETSLSGEVYVLGDIENDWNVRATMQKCHDIRNLDTCDFYKSVSIIKNGCLDSEEADVYNLLFQYITPKMDCPVQAGNYTINHFPYFTEDSDLTGARSKISTSVFGYTYRLEGYSNENIRLLCIESHLRLNYIRHYDWTGGKNYSDHLAPGTDSDEENEIIAKTGKDTKDGKDLNDSDDEA